MLRLWRAEERRTELAKEREEVVVGGMWVVETSRDTDEEMETNSSRTTQREEERMVKSEREMAAAEPNENENHLAE